jgi:hypothetical protein
MLIPIKRVLGVPLSNKINELKAQPQGVKSQQNLNAHLLTRTRTSVVDLHPTEARHSKTMELWHEVRSLVSDLADQLRSCLPCNTQALLKRLQVPHVTCLPTDQHVVRLPTQMSQCVVVFYDKELRVPFKVTPPMFDRFAYGQKLPNQRQGRCCHAQLDSAYAPSERLVESLLLGLVPILMQSPPSK